MLKRRISMQEQHCPGVIDCKGCLLDGKLIEAYRACGVSWDLCASLKNRVVAIVRLSEYICVGNWLAHNSVKHIRRLFRLPCRVRSCDIHHLASSSCLQFCHHHHYIFMLRLSTAQRKSKWSWQGLVLLTSKLIHEWLLNCGWSRVMLYVVAVGII